VASSPTSETSSPPSAWRSISACGATTPP
jgi:hypothetical protein